MLLKRKGKNHRARKFLLDGKVSLPREEKRAVAELLHSSPWSLIERDYLALCEEQGVNSF